MEIGKILLICFGHPEQQICNRMLTYDLWFRSINMLIMKYCMFLKYYSQMTLIQNLIWLLIGLINTQIEIIGFISSSHFSLKGKTYTSWWHSWKQEEGYKYTSFFLLSSICIWPTVLYHLSSWYQLLLYFQSWPIYLSTTQQKITIKTWK